MVSVSRKTEKVWERQKALDHARVPASQALHPQISGDLDGRSTGQFRRLRDIFAIGDI
jgi:hypothetical protein